MDKKVVGLLGAVSALALMGTAKASPAVEAPTAPPPAQSYADLLKPVPNAAAVLAAEDAKATDGSYQVAQYYYHHHHHHHWRRWHHHHHHHFWRRHFWHHHHHYY